MGRKKRAKGQALVTPEEAASVVSEMAGNIASRLFGKSLAGQIAAKAAGRVVLNALGGKPQRSARKLKARPSEPARSYMIAPGVEYFPAHLNKHNKP